MSRERSWLILFLLPLLLLSRRASAQQFCAEAKTEKKCVQNVDDELLKNVSRPKELQGVDAQKALAEMNKTSASPAMAKALLTKLSPEIAALPTASAAFDTFLNRLRIGVTTEGSDQMPDLVIDFTDFLGLPTKNGYKVQTVARNPVLDDELSKQLSQENRDKRTQGLGSFDDVLVSLAFSPSTLHFGNNLGASQLLIDDLFQQFLAKNQALKTKSDDAATAKRMLVRNLPAAAFTDQGGLDFEKIADPALQRAAREATERAAVAEANRLAALSKTLEVGRFFEIADLVANQPQLVFKATQTARDELVGPEETTVKFSYEQGFVNMNSLRRKLAACAPEQIADCYTDYVTGHQAELARAQNRLTFSLDWTRQQGYHPSVDGVSLTREGKDRRTIAATFGRNLRVEDDKPTSRFDLTASWEDWSDDPMHQDRAMASLSFAQRVNDDMSLVLGAVWASKPEFRGQVDKAVSARFGLTYRFLDAKAKEKMKAAG
jgi:hypothetical protein